MKHHEGTFEALRAAGAPAEGPAYADAGAVLSVLLVADGPSCGTVWAERRACRVYSLDLINLSYCTQTTRTHRTRFANCKPLLLPTRSADTAAQALMAVAPVGVAHYRLERLQLA